MHRLPLDTEEIARLYLEEGLRGDEIARRMGCSSSVVYARLDEAGVLRSRSARLSKEQVVTLYVDEGWSALRVGRELGVAPQTITRYLKLWGVPVRNKVQAHQPRGRPACPESLTFRSYLLGFVWGDMSVERRPGGQTVSVRGSTTKAVQLDLIRQVFSPFGKVKIHESKTAWSTRVSLDESFEFLFDKYGTKVPPWIRGAAPEAAFVAGYVDAEGSFGVYDGRARFKLVSYDGPVHTWMGAWADRNGISAPRRVTSRRPPPVAGQPVRPGEGELWCTNVNESFSLLRLIATIEPYVRHGRRRTRMADATANIVNRLRARDPDGTHP